MGNVIICAKQKTPPASYFPSSQQENVLSEQQVDESFVKDNNDSYFNEEELLYYERMYSNNEHQVVKQMRWQSQNHFLGQGSFGSVELGMDQETGKQIAVKQLSLKGFNPQQIDLKIQSFKLEIELLSKLSHKNIVKYLGMEQTQSHLNLFLEYVPGGSIKQLLDKYGKFPENLVKTYIYQILCGLEYLHANGIIHRDIKGANILVDGKGICKLADFGSSKKLTMAKEECKTFTGTPNWMAPEVINQKGHGRFADIWSLGCTVLEMLTGKPPWSDGTNRNCFQIIIEIAKGQPPKIPNELKDETKDFLSKCFQSEPKDRWNVKKLLRHQFISNKSNESASEDISNVLKGIANHYA